MSLPNRATAQYVTAAAVCLFVFTVLTLGVTGVWRVDPWDGEIAGQVAHGRNPALTNAMFTITSLGDSAYLIFMGLLIVGVPAARRAWRPAVATAAAFLLLPFLVSSLKAIIARVRPTADLYSGADAFSFPSGHAANATLIYGTLAVLALTSLKGTSRRVICTGLVLLIILIGVSRIYIGAHWPSDALAGLALGGAVLSLLTCVLTRTHPTPASPRTTTFLLIAFTLTAPLYAWYALPFARTFYTALS